MKLTRTVLISILVMVLVSAWSLPPAGVNFTSPEIQGDPMVVVSAPVAAGGTITLQVTNKTGGVIAQFKLTGVKSYTFYNLPVGKNTFTVEKGKYKIEYKACGANKTKNLNLTGNKKFNTVSCPVAKVTIINSTGGNMYLSLTGPANYSFNLAPGTNKITVLKGSYQYYVSGGCGSKSGTVNMKNQLRWTWWCY
jgi:hypothetical protein